MVEMKQLEWKKRDDLCKGIVSLGVSIEDAKRIFEYLEDECVIEITSPQMKAPVLQTVKMQAAHTGRITGKSYKPGNIIFNMKDGMVNSLALGASIAASIGAVSLSQPVIAILTILGAMLSAANLWEKELDEDAVLILAVLWESRNTYDQLIDIEASLAFVNTYLESYNSTRLSKVRYNDLLDDLNAIKCIELKDGKIKLKEKINIEY